MEIQVLGKTCLFICHLRKRLTGFWDSLKLEGKVALVTGGDFGIGRAVCHCFVMEGATVAFTYVKGPEDKDAQETLRILNEAKTPHAKTAIAIGVNDLGFDENRREVVEEVVSAFGRIDVLVNNAAEQHMATTIEEISQQRLERASRPTSSRISTLLGML
ncbi:hypothetical protein MLD38_025521 [Melastoma candidum]|uniref:Uncharacterized protein n=1 Tax=Melastoma candidum TaxID=119954 RepID=A0ACB9P0T6_9MYRT|nr:hypothetical protein MLD38_025521 [Melastoma candidum]